MKEEDRFQTENTFSTQENQDYRYPYPSLPLYVHALKNSLYQEGDGGNRLENWLSTIQPMSSKDHRVVKARIETNYGKGHVFELNSTQPLPSQIDKDTSVDQALNANSYYQAKLELIRRMDEVPWLVKIQAEKKLKEAKKEAAELLTKSGEKRKITREYKIGDILGKIDLSNKKMLRNVLPALSFFLASCQHVEGKPIRTPVSEKTSNVLVAGNTETPEPTRTPTKTVEPSPTPEILVGDPRDVNSWPEKYSEYFLNDWENTGMDEDFQKFMNKIRADYLEEKGNENATQMTSEQLMWAMIEDAKLNKEKVILTIPEIIKIITVEGSVMSTNGKTLEDPDNTGAWYRKKGEIMVPSEVAERLFGNSKYTTRVYGRSVLVPRAPFTEIRGYLAGIVTLPGWEKSTAILTEVRTDKGEKHLAIAQIYEEKHVFDQSSWERCISLGKEDPRFPGSVFYQKTCPDYYVQTKLYGMNNNFYIDYDNPIVGPGMVEQFMEKYFFPNEPDFIVVGSDVQWLDDESRGILIEGYLDPATGLEAAQFIVVKPE